MRSSLSLLFLLAMHAPASAFLDFSPDNILVFDPNDPRVLSFNCNRIREKNQLDCSVSEIKVSKKREPADETKFIEEALKETDMTKKSDVIEKQCNESHQTLLALNGQTDDPTPVNLQEAIRYKKVHEGFEEYCKNPSVEGARTVLREIFKVDSSTCVYHVHSYRQVFDEEKDGYPYVSSGADDVVGGCNVIRNGRLLQGKMKEGGFFRPWVYVRSVKVKPSDDGKTDEKCEAQEEPETQYTETSKDISLGCRYTEFETE